MSIIPGLKETGHVFWILSHTCTEGHGETVSKMHFLKYTEHDYFTYRKFKRYKHHIWEIREIQIQ